MDRMIVRTLCEDVFSAFLTQFVHFEEPYHLVLIKHSESNFSSYQNFLLDILKQRGWRIEILNTSLTGDNTCYEVYSYVLRNSLRQFFWVDDDVFFGEDTLRLLKEFSVPDSMVAPVVWFLHLNSYQLFTPHLPDPMPIYFNLRKVPKIQTKILLSQEGHLFGWAILTLLFSQYTKIRLLISPDGPLSIHATHKREHHKNTPWKPYPHLVDLKIREYIKKFCPDFAKRTELILVYKNRFNPFNPEVRK